MNRSDRGSANYDSTGAKIPIMTKEQEEIMVEEKKTNSEQELKSKIKQDLLRKVSGKDRDKIEFLLKRL
jgi:hypothetical protein